MNINITSLIASDTEENVKRIKQRRRRHKKRVEQRQGIKGAGKIEHHAEIMSGRFKLAQKDRKRLKFLEDVINLYQRRKEQMPVKLDSIQQDYGPPGIQERMLKYVIKKSRYEIVDGKSMEPREYYQDFEFLSQERAKLQMLFDTLSASTRYGGNTIAVPTISTRIQSVLELLPGLLWEYRLFVSIPLPTC